ncbi:MAG: hypothetical protein MZW92_57365 [Comamonadaceae bacterium]|nr:hypothetical protein [Comamonadaceae bacterium]
MIWGRVTERTAADPTPADRELFSIQDGGISASTIGDLGEVEAEMPLPKGGGVKVRIPLKKVDEGRPAPFDEGDHQLYAVPPNVDQVDVFMAARSSADAYIETALTGLAPWLSRNWNDSNAFASFLLNWKSVAVGSGGAGGQAGAAAVVAGVPTCGRDPLQTPVGTVVPTKGKYAGKTIRYADRRGKHTKVASCALVDLTAALATEPARLLGELRKFVEACKARDTAYGGQLSAEGRAQYRELMLSALENGNPDESFRTKAPNKIGMRIGGSGCTATDFYVVKDDAVGPKAEFHLHPAA